MSGSPPCNYNFNTKTKWNSSIEKKVKATSQSPNIRRRRHLTPMMLTDHRQEVAEVEEVVREETVMRGLLLLRAEEAKASRMIGKMTITKHAKTPEVEKEMLQEVEVATEAVKKVMRVATS